MILVSFLHSLSTKVTMTVDAENRLEYKRLKIYKYNFYLYYRICSRSFHECVYISNPAKVITSILIIQVIL